MSNKTKVAVPLITFTFLLLSGCVGESGDGGGAPADESAAPAGGAMDAAGLPPVSGDTITTASGLRYIVIEAGDGPSPEPGDLVAVHYTGWLTSGLQFDSSVGGQPIRFPLGQGRVIRGWDEGIDSLKVGSKARLIIPPDLAYGTAGRPPIPPNSTLISTWS